METNKIYSGIKNALFGREKNEEGPKSLGGISSNTWDETLLYHKLS